MGKLKDNAIVPASHKLPTNRHHPSQRFLILQVVFGDCESDDAFDLESICGVIDSVQLDYFVAAEQGRLLFEVA